MVVLSWERLLAAAQCGAAVVDRATSSSPWWRLRSPEQGVCPIPRPVPCSAVLTELGGCGTAPGGRKNLPKSFYFAPRSLILLPKSLIFFPKSLIYLPPNL